MDGIPEQQLSTFTNRQCNHVIKSCKANVLNFFFLFFCSFFLFFFFFFFLFFFFLFSIFTFFIFFVEFLFLFSTSVQIPSNFRPVFLPSSVQSPFLLLSISVRSPFLLLHPHPSCQIPCRLSFISLYSIFRYFSATERYLEFRSTSV